MQLVAPRLCRLITLRKVVPGYKHIDLDLDRMTHASSIMMTFNMCHPAFDPVVTCDKVSSDGHEITNLVSSSPCKIAKGFLASSFVTPPVCISIKLFCASEIHCVLIHPQVGSQKSIGFEVMVPGLVLGKGFINDECGVCFQRLNSEPAKKVPEGFATFTLKRRCSDTILVRILRSRGVPAVRCIEVWGRPFNEFQQECSRRWLGVTERKLELPKLSNTLCVKFSEVEKMLSQLSSSLQVMQSLLEQLEAELSKTKHMHNLGQLLNQACQMLVLLPKTFRQLVDCAKKEEVSKCSAILLKFPDSLASLLECLSPIPELLSQVDQELQRFHKPMASLCSLLFATVRVSLQIRAGLANGQPLQGKTSQTVCELCDKLNDCVSHARQCLGGLIAALANLSKPHLQSAKLCQELIWNAMQLSSAFTKRDELEVPEEFTDAITCELMTIPMILPSGKTVDMTTLDRLSNTEANWGRKPCDPFTGRMLSDTHRVVPAVALKERIDTWVMRHANAPEVKSVGRTLGRKPEKRKAEATITSQSKRAGTFGEYSGNLDSVVNNYVQGLDSPKNSSDSQNCGKCTAKENLYLLPCVHVVCRQCLTSCDKECHLCSKPFQSRDVSRFHV